MVALGTRGSFVARIWLEGDENGEPTWRGHIQHVQGRQETYFQNLEEMNAFIERVSGVAGPAGARPAGEEKSVSRAKHGTTKKRAN
jgi:hypothetical protein